MDSGSQYSHIHFLQKIQLIEIYSTQIKEMEKFRLKEYLHYNLLIIKYLGLWPKSDYFSDKLYFLYSLIISTFFSLSLSIGLTVYVLVSSNLLEDIIGSAYFLLGIMATAKYFFIMKYTKMFKKLVDVEIHTSLNVKLNEKQYKILCDYVGFWKKVNIYYNLLSILMLVNYVVLPIFSKRTYALPMQAWYPFDYKKPIVYEVVYVHQSITALIDIFVNIDGATLAAGVLAYISAECEVLVDMLTNLNKDNFDDDVLSTKGLKICVEYHKKIVEYSKLVERYFSKYLLIQFTSSCVSTALIMTSLNMSHDVNMEFWFLSVLQLGVWADLYVYCWYGNEVTVKSMKIPYAAFKSNWVNASRTFKKDLLFFIIRTQTPIRIYAVSFIELSLNTFIGILRTAYSYYMLLRQLSTREE